MLEEQLIGYLEEKTGLHTSNEKTAGRIPQEYILVQRTGGSEVNMVDGAVYAIQSISSISKLRAAEINELVKSAMRRFNEAANISSCKLNSDYDFTDARSKEYRYQAIYEIVYF